MNNPIGIIDSGVGGLTIVSRLIQELPKESLIYIADSKNCPYGEKSSKAIYKLTKAMIEFLVKNKAKLVLIACNTITVSAIGKLRKEYPNLPIVGIVPVIKTAVLASKNRKIGILSTVNTARSKSQKDLIKEFAKGYRVINVGNSKLVPLIEALNNTQINKVLKKDLEIFKKEKIDVLVLGCSHFPLIKGRIQKYLPEVLILDSSKAVVSQVEKILKRNKILSKYEDSSYNFYTTGDMKALEYFSKKMTSKAKLSIISLL